MKVLEDSSSPPLNNAPLPFNHIITFDFLNNFWTWLAFIFFRIIPSQNPQLLPLPPSTSDHHNVNDDRQPARVVHTSVTSTAAASTTNVDGFTKGKMKFTYYYSEEDDDIVDDDNDGECDETLKITEEEEGEGILLGWENLLRIRNGVNDNGWYTCQDLRLINGNVVRFWDDGFGFSSIANGATK